MKILFLVIFCFFSVDSFCQSNKIDSSSNSEVVHLPEYYQGEGVIFNENYDVQFSITNIRNRYSPSINDIQKAEEILSEKYNELRGTNIDFKRKFRKYLRQYVGLIDLSGKRNIIVQILDTSKKRKFKKAVGKSYREKFVMIFDAQWLKSQIFKINLDLDTITTQL